ncbi:acyl-CoA dehydrogenase family protein [Curtobacterium sp. TXMA1]|uniref:acyl-CoA dehydrogenase family protein n=1 Tax=Curtobacterium sp. TXMA1 TaxID=2876939 RepID=UPI001CCD9026|nr:acyl-CoA dehydrogenase family protein [Curtobacterium sp. TXMA1]UBQ03199.1 acyl-CoA dehydrogenase family protein [Curtobacterium sp. TXMA1]
MGHQLLGPTFATFLEEVRAAAAHTDRTGRLPRRFHDQLRRLGFGRMRLSSADGGLGASVIELVETITDIAAADPNLAQSWRTHVLATERHLKEADGPTRRQWLGRIASGAMIGGGWTEADGSTGAKFTTRLHDGDGTLRLTGTKYYSTGSAHADWLEYSAVDDEDSLVIVGVDAGADGVVVRDDWTGFGQRATGSGTTELHGVPVDPADVAPFATQHRGAAGWQQLVLLAVLTGITRDVARTAAELIDESGRRHGPPDVRVLERFGRLEALVLGTDATLLRAATDTDAAHRALVSGPGPVADRTADAAEVQTFRAQVLIVPAAVEAGGLLTQIAALLPEPLEDLQQRWALDRHWRNARTIAQHNPVLHRSRMIADRLLYDIGTEVDVRSRDTVRAEAVRRDAEARTLPALRIGGDLADALAADRSLRLRLAGLLAERSPVLLVLEDDPSAGDPTVAAASLLGDLPRAWFAVTTRARALGHPYDLARRIATLDQLSGGRIAWVLRGGPDSDVTELVTVVQQLWRSWPRETLALDGSAPAFAETAAITRINSTGAYRIAGPLNVPSSPQGLPVTVTSGGASVRATGTCRVDLVERADDLVLAGSTDDAVPAVRMDALVHHDLETLAAALQDRTAAHDDRVGTLRRRLGVPAPVLDPLDGAAPRFDDAPEAS